MKNTAVIAFTKKGAQIAQKIAVELNAIAYVREKDAGEMGLPIVESLRDWTRERFEDSRYIVFVGAVGIAVRAIAPFIVSKTKDPAVIVVDEGANFAISLLSGHIGGANEMAKRIAEIVGAQPVITTATDTRGVWAVDEWARKCGHIIENPGNIVKISSALLDGQTVPVSSNIPIICDLPRDIVLEDCGKLGVWISYIKISPFEESLLIRPKVLTLGVGCKKNISPVHMDKTINQFLEINGISELSICRIASIDLKADEPALIALSSLRGWELVTHTAQELEGAISDTDFGTSKFVQSVTGVESVCDRAASLHGDLIVKKTVYSGITLALSCAKWEIVL